MLQRNVRAFVLPALILGVLTRAAYPQGERGTISGTVTDATQAVVAGAGIAIRNVDTNVTSRTTSNSSGLFVFPALPPGSYDLTAEKQGFRAVKISGIPLSVGLTVTVETSTNLLDWQRVGAYLLDGGTNYFLAPVQNRTRGFYRGRLP